MEHLNNKVQTLVVKFGGNSYSKFAEMIGVSPTTISDICHGKTNVGGKVVLKIAAKFPEVDMNWLLKNESDLSMVNEDQSKYISEKSELYDIEKLVRKVEELDAIVQELLKKE